MNIDNTNLLYSAPEIVSGSELSDSDMLTMATYRFPNKNYATLRHWMIIDIVGTEQQLKKIIDAKKSPTIVYYHSVDSTRLENSTQNNQSYSDYQISCKDNLFETEKTVYLLMGKGFRKTVSASLFSLLK
jgi:hypothetical protein